MPERKAIPEAKQQKPLPPSPAHSGTAAPSTASFTTESPETPILTASSLSTKTVTASWGSSLGRVSLQDNMAKDCRGTVLQLEEAGNRPTLRL